MEIKALINKLDNIGRELHLKFGADSYIQRTELSKIREELIDGQKNGISVDEILKGSTLLATIKSEFGKGESEDLEKELRLLINKALGKT